MWWDPSGRAGRNLNICCVGAERTSWRNLGPGERSDKYKFNSLFKGTKETTKQTFYLQFRII